MKKIESIAALQNYVSEQRAAGKTISFVPTMGALHDGHIELVRRGLAMADICIPYIFVNPTQFAPTEDLAAYPRTLDADLEKLEEVGASAIYLPRADEVYPNGPQVTHTVQGISAPLEGEFRPAMFGGVATVLAKMFDDAKPDIALFGEKDYQQLMVIRQLVKDLKLPIEIVGVPIVRDSNGLALSSRNAYLSKDEYLVAITLNKILFEMSARYQQGAPIDEIEKWAAQQLLDEGFASVDYIVIRDADTLLPPTDATENLRALAAATIGRARLIDNIPIIP
jgi:pantoate--beta-alanine ligase